MISKKDAIKEYVSSSGLYEKARVEKLYDVIVHSIGSCDECKDSGKCNIQTDGMLWGRSMQYCSDFERKE